MEKLENVVNPPKKPINIRERQKSLRLNRSINSVAKSPIKKEPKIFTIKIPKGKPMLDNDCMRADSKNLKIEPIAPPSAIAIKICITFPLLQNK